MSEPTRKPAMDLDDLSVPELTVLIGAAEAKRAEKMTGARDALLAEFREKAAQLGMPLEALMGRRQATEATERTRRRRSDAGKPRPAKYRDPESGATWSGRGREPRWLKGQDRERFAVEA